MNIFFISHAEVNLPKPLVEMSLVDIRGVNPELLEIMFSAHTNNVKRIIYYVIRICFLHLYKVKTILMNLLITEWK